MGSWPCFPDVQAELGTEGEATFLLAPEEGEETNRAAAACHALGAVVSLCDFITPRLVPRMVLCIICSHLMEIARQENLQVALIHVLGSLPILILLLPKLE